jgi:hypothetical protein
MNNIKVEDFLIKSLMQGLTLPEIAVKLQNKGIAPSSLSTIEKSFKSLKLRYNAKTPFQLAIKLCKAGLIDL